MGFRGKQRVRAAGDFRSQRGAKRLPTQQLAGYYLWHRRSMPNNHADFSEMSITLKSLSR